MVPALMYGVIGFFVVLILGGAIARAVSNPLRLVCKIVEWAGFIGAGWVFCQLFLHWTVLGDSGGMLWLLLLLCIGIAGAGGVAAELSPSLPSLLGFKTRDDED